jgi:putative transposase
VKSKTEILQPSTFYHIYNRSNGNDNLFLTHTNYLFFLEKYKQYIHPICNTYCYCVMPNHFHFLIEIKNENDLITFFQKEKTDFNLIYSDKLSSLLSKQFSNFLNSYSKAFNKQQERKGNLFMRSFKRKKIVNKRYLLKLVHYIHYNPIQAGLSKKMNEWNYSSYNSLLSKSLTLLQREKVIEWFDDMENFIYIHKQIPKEINIIFD